MEIIERLLSRPMALPPMDILGKVTCPLCALVSSFKVRLLISTSQNGCEV